MIEVFNNTGFLIKRIIRLVKLCTIGALGVGSKVFAKEELHLRDIAVFADDLTGANASAGALARALGVPITVSEVGIGVRNGPVVLNTRSREDPTRRQWVSQWTKELWGRGYRGFDKRVDTTLRGPAPYELNLLVQSLPTKPWIGVVAGYPLAGRTTVHGRQFVWNKPVGQVFSEVATDFLPAYFFGDSNGAYIVTTEELNQDFSGLAERLILSHTPVVFDVENQVDLQNIARVLQDVEYLHEGPVVTATSGAVLEYYVAPMDFRVVVIVGSPTQVNLDQIQYISRRRSVRLASLMDPVTPINTPSVVILHSGLEPISSDLREDITEDLAKAAYRRLDELRKQNWVPQRIILTGGEMAQAFLDCTYAKEVRIQTLLAPLVGQGTIIGGEYHGIEIVTKGGLVGTESLLYELSKAPRVSQDLINL